MPRSVLQRPRYTSPGGQNTRQSRAAPPTQGKELASEEYEEIEKLWQASKKALEGRAHAASARRGQPKSEPKWSGASRRSSATKNKSAHSHWCDCVWRARDYGNYSGDICRDPKNPCTGRKSPGRASSDAWRSRGESCEAAKSARERNTHPKIFKKITWRVELTPISTFIFSSNAIANELKLKMQQFQPVRKRRHKAISEILLNEVGKLGADLTETISAIRRENEHVWNSGFRSEADRSKVVTNIVEQLRSFPYRTLENKLRVALYAIAAIPEDRAILNNSLRGIIEEADSGPTLGYPPHRSSGVLRLLNAGQVSLLLLATIMGWCGDGIPWPPLRGHPKFCRSCGKRRRKRTCIQCQWNSPCRRLS